MVSDDVLIAALAWHDAGCSVIRARIDGTKAPDGLWAQWQHGIADVVTLSQWFANGYPGIGVVCGAVSGNLEMLELEGRAVLDGTAQRFWDLMDTELADVKERLLSGYCETSPSGGIHIMFRVEGTPVLGNAKLAQRPNPDKTSLTRRLALIETRGEGGFVVVAPSHGPVHPSGKPWRLVAGSPATLAVLTPEEYRALHQVAASLDEMPVLASQPAAAGLNGLPGYDPTEAPSWAAILQPAGWVARYEQRGRTYWRRPGKNIGVSAVTGGDIDQFWCWSTSVAGVEPERSYTRFGLYAAVWCGGDFSEARRQLSTFTRPISQGSELIMATTEDVPGIDPADLMEIIQVKNELKRIRVHEKAKQLYALENTISSEPVQRDNAVDFLDTEDPPIVYRVDKVWPTGGNIIIAGQAKVGKSILLGNLIKCLADGGDFLAQFSTEMVDKQIVLIDNELDKDTLRRRVRALHIENLKQLDCYSFRGRITQFNILDAHGREKWAQEFKSINAGIIILDCLRPMMDAFGLDENRDAGRVIGAFEALRQECGATEGLIVHHMGHSGERSRGDSRLIDWPDATWKMTREDPDNPASDRYFSAYGRNVEIPESQLWFNELSNNHLTIPTLGDGRNKIKAKKTAQVNTDENVAIKKCIREILSSLGDFSPGMSKNEIYSLIGGRKQNVLNAIEQMIFSSEITVNKGGRTGSALLCKLSGSQ